ncbi:MAG: hypothetical protein CLLPBCKN_007618 [Chroococcidiopsis cubana SAG 39.79]|uniref:DUF192 domain-containing protein n=1 Tax=Chroococcidiopsis cubana SAG 39.79 TaxID=388085 RepID=A0AB37USX5_9CYAN|nr:DUF192 domain-containing protein [Chroococcidiopsis cubana]MDZ4878183.1 hypothetical protein [Chroococcidiopsis cubana SAG 39.79]PSB66561.1 DUF192 domain-containing protein [Chroococcidiopsis cubana CCALA 043]RUT14553.1 hypothetical protein DSM107010_00990 [Chroococcidiopsis cubana SAG 39.79]
MKENSAASHSSRQVGKCSADEVYLKILNCIGPVAGILVAVVPVAFALIPPPAQQLPIEAHLPMPARKIELEVARTPEQVAAGLRSRSSLPLDRGMLFVVSKPKPVKLWMKDVLVPLDIIFIRSGTVTSLVKNAPPCPRWKSCPIYDSVKPVSYVLELPAGSANRLGIQPGRKLDVKFTKARKRSCYEASRCALAASYTPLR